MERTKSTEIKNQTMEMATFNVGEALCGMDILRIQEINRHMEMTDVPQSPEYVMGILNLRGQIVTVIDLGKKLGLSETRLNDNTRNIVVNSKGEHIGFMVEKINDVVKTDLDSVEPPPANMGGLQGRFFEGVFKTGKRLIGILDVEEVLKDG